MRNKILTKSLIVLMGLFLFATIIPAQFRTTPIKKGPDLQIKIICPNPAKAYAGQSLGKSIKVWVKNVGNTPAQNFSVDLVLSKDTNIPVKFAVYSPNFSDDVLLKGGREFVKFLGPKKTISVTLNGTNTIPSDTPPGNYYLGAVVDPGNKVKEFNEGNNTAICRLLIYKTEPQVKLPDLIVKDIKLVNDCKIAVTVANIGNAGVPADKYVLPKAVGVQMYNGSKPWGGLILKGFDPAGKLKNPGGVATYIWFPGAKNLQLGPGIHTIKVVVDHLKNLVESNEGNNSLTRRLKCKTGQGSGISVGKYSIYNIRFSPKSPASLNLNQKVNITFNYVISKKAHIWARPMTGNSTTPGYAASGSKLHPAGKGSASQYFKITSGKGIINRVRFQIKDKSKKKLLYQKYVSVNYKYPRSQVVVTAPKRFLLDFNDAYLVYQPSTKILQITAQSNVLSYGSDWQRAKVKSYLYDLKEKFWKGFYWRVNTSRKEVYRVKGGTFGKISPGKKEKLTNVTVDVVGNSNNPTRFFLRFKTAYLVYVPKTKTLQIITEGNVLSYGSDWQRCNLKSYLYHLKQNVWKGFYWKVNTSRKQVYRITGGTFCKISAGSSAVLNIGVRVVE